MLDFQVESHTYTQPGFYFNKFRQVILIVGICTVASSNINPAVTMSAKQLASMNGFGRYLFVCLSVGNLYHTYSDFFHESVLIFAQIQLNDPNIELDIETQVRFFLSAFGSLIFTFAAQNID